MKMVESLGMIVAAGWGFGMGVLTSIPLGPTGAMVLGSATRGDRKGILYAVGGFASAQIFFQAVFHLGFAKVLQGQPLFVNVLGTLGVLGTAFCGTQHLLRARSLSRASGLLPEPTPSPISDAHSTPLFLKSLSIAFLNPFLLFFILANVSMFLQSFPSYGARPYIASLLGATLAGTVLWYLFFGEFILRRSSAWGLKGRVRAELISGSIMVAAGLFLLLRLSLN